jgi:cytochrome c
MDFLKELATPQSLEHFRLVIVIAALSSAVLTPYLGFVLGSSILSLWLGRRSRTTGDRHYVLVARAVTDIALFDKSTVTFLAIIPGAALVFCYAQMFQGSAASATGLGGTGFLLLIAGLVLLYARKYTFRVQGVLDAYLEGKESEGKGATDDAREYSSSNARAHRLAGGWGVTALALAAFLYVGAAAVAMNPSAWDSVTSVPDLLLSGEVWVRFFLFVTFAAGATGVGILYFSRQWETDVLRPVAARPAGRLAARLGVRLAVGAMLLLPLLVILNVAILPDTSLSGSVYGVAGAAILLTFLAAHGVYAFQRGAGGITLGAIALLAAGVLLAMNDHVAIVVATREHAAQLAFRHGLGLEEMKTRLGITRVMLTGEEIYTARCSSCHLFDQKKVGPPYFETVPKYGGKKGDLMAFILNPVKKNPAYPPMPNPGLRPAEADSIATYLLLKIARGEGKKE